MKNKILFILHLPPPVHGSSVVGKQIFDSEKINKKYNCIFINLSTSNGVDKIGKISLDKFTLYFEILFKIIKTLLFQSFDKVYLAPTVSKGGFYKDYIVYFILFLFNKKRIYHLHNKGVSKRKKGTVLDFLYRSFFKNAKVILLSERLFQDVEEFVNKEDVFICPNGIEDEVGCINRKQKEKKEQLNLLFLSNLIISKGVLVLLDACEKLAQSNVNFICNFVGGEGDISKEFFNKKVKELKLENNVFYLGKKYDKEKKDIFLKSDIFVFPTFYHNECFPLVSLEAMMYELPVISTDEGGIADIIVNNKTGFVVKKEKVNALVEKILLLIKDKELRVSMGKNGRNRFEENFSDQKFEETLCNILNQL